MIEIEETIVHRAAGGDTAALSDVICRCYPTVCRICVGISGDSSRGLALVSELVRQSIAASERWQDEAAPWRWFVHHAILNLRRFPPAEVAHDPLLQYSADRDLPFVSFIRALRKLHPQQMEAFILHHGERLEQRPLAIAMDCSTTAATNHLAAANEQLRLVAAGEFDARLTALRRAYDALSPDEQQVRKYVLANVRTRTAPRKLWRWIKRAFALIGLIAVTYVLWRVLQYMSS